MTRASVKRTAIAILYEVLEDFLKLSPHNIDHLAELLVAALVKEGIKLTDEKVDRKVGLLEKVDPLEMFREEWDQKEETARHKREVERNAMFRRTLDRIYGIKNPISEHLKEVEGGGS